MQKTQFLGLECSILNNSSLSMLIANDIGPRIVSLRVHESENLFAELETVTLDCPGTGKLKMYGGHRLWHAPEEPSRTYLPDDHPVEIISLDHGLRINQQIEQQTGMQKSIQIILPDDSPRVELTHTITNKGLWPVETAAWAITQMKPGCTAILPQITLNTGVLPNRSLTLWPYTEMNDPSITWGNQFICIDANKKSGSNALKLGFANPRGWIACWNQGILFVKKTAFYANKEYFDYGSSSECYCNNLFLELESISPRTILNPGETITHLETWEIYENVQFSKREEDIKNLVDTLHLE